MREREMPCMGQTRCLSRPITFWSSFIKKPTVLQKKIEENFFTVAKPKFTVAIGDHSVADVEPWPPCQGSKVDSSY